MGDRDKQFKAALQAQENKQVQQSKTSLETKLKIKILAERYYTTWKREVNFSIIPAGLTDERCIKTLERIILTGETFLTGYNCLYRTYIYQSRPYMYNMVSSAYKKPTVINPDYINRSFRIDNSNRTNIIKFRAKNKLNGNIWH